MPAEPLSTVKWLDLLQKVGFPIFVACVLMYVVWKDMEHTKAFNDRLFTKMEKTTDALVERMDKLNASILELTRVTHAETIGRSSGLDN